MNKQLGLMSVIVLGATLAAQPAGAAVSFYAPYENSLNLTIGSPSVPTAVSGTVSYVTGFPVSSMAGSAANFTGGTNGVIYGNVSSYMAGTTPSSVIGSNAFRLLFKPSFSGPNVAVRHQMFGVGPLGSGDSIAIFHSDDARGPAFLMTSVGGGASWFANAVSNFNWNSSAWYYLGASFDQNGAAFYVRELSNSSLTGLYQSVTFSGAQSWGASMGQSGYNVNVGMRPPFFGSGFENAAGAIDDVKIFSGERWGLAEFNADWLEVMPVPEPTMALLLAAGGLILWRRRNG